MSISIKINDAAFTKFIDKIFPRMDLAQALYFFGGDAAASTKNYINSSLPASIVGTPTYTPNGILVGNANYVDSGILGQYPTTMAIVSINENPNGGFGNPTTIKTSFISAPGIIRASRGGTDISINTPTKPTGVNAVFRCITYDGATLKLYVSDGSTTLLSGSFTGTATLAPTLSFKVGGVSSSGNGTVYAASLHNNVLSAAEVASLMQYMDYKLANRGINLIAA